MRNVCMLATVIFLFLSAQQIKAQVSINNPVAPPHASAMLDVNSTNKGVLVPRITLTATNSATPVTSPQTSLLVYNTATAGAGGTAVTPGFYYWNGSAWVKLASDSGSSSAWALTGNAGTDTSINFIGTTDNEALIFKVNGKRIGLLEDTFDIQHGNIAWGIDALTSNTDGGSNVAIGQLALKRNTIGGYNVALGFASMINATGGAQKQGIGTFALGNNSNGVANAAIGDFALRSNTDGFQNIAIGFSSLVDNTSGSNNIAMGAAALANNVTGNKNIAFGHRSLYTNTGTSNSIAMGDSVLYSLSAGAGLNTAMGARSMRNTTTGSGNIAIGPLSLFSNTGGNRNIAIGYAALYSSTGGSSTIAIGDSAGYANIGGFANSFVGYRSGRNNFDGYRNTFFGVHSGLANVSGNDNVFIGSSAGQNNLAQQNTFVGSAAGIANTVGNNNVFLGSSAGGANDQGFNSTFIGSGAGRLTTLGNSNVFIGSQSGSGNTLGSANTIIGTQANVGEIGLSNASAIGYLAFVSQSNSIVLGSINGINSSINDTKVGIGTTAPSAMLHVDSRANTSTYGIRVGGNFNEVAIAPDIEDGSNMFFYPAKAAFRAGYVASGYWNNSNMGIYSVALGQNAIAKGESSFAAGRGSQAIGGWSVAMGGNAKANSNFSVAIGNDAVANGVSSTALGLVTRSNGLASFAANYFTIAKGFAGTVVGMYNDSLLVTNETAANTNTPLFIVGNGNNDISRSNALVVRKSGTVEVENIQIGAGTVISKQQAGTYAAGTSATQANQFTITFPSAFTITPKIIVTPRSPVGINATDVYAVSIRSVSTTTAIVNVFRVDFAGGWGQNLQLDWFAWEQ